MRRAFFLAVVLLTLPAIGSADDDVSRAQEIVRVMSRLNQDETRPLVVGRHAPPRLLDLPPFSPDVTRRTTRIVPGAVRRTSFETRSDLPGFRLSGVRLLDLPPFADVESRAPVGVPPAAEDATQGPPGVLASESTLPESG